MVRKSPSFCASTKVYSGSSLHVGNMNDLALKQGASRCSASLRFDWQIFDKLLKVTEKP